MFLHGVTARQRIRLALLPAILAATQLVGGCALPTALPEAASLEPRGDRIVIVGKAVLDPPFEPELEQQTRWNVIGDGAIKNRVMISTDAEPRAVRPGSLDVSDWQGFIDARWGEYFVAELPRQTRYLNGLMVPLDVARQDYLWFPGGLVLRPPEDGNVLYVGTLRYVRNDFNEIVDIDVRDDREEALDALATRFGRRPADLTSALWLRQLPWESGE